MVTRTSISSQILLFSHRLERIMEILEAFSISCVCFFSCLSVRVSFSIRCNGLQQLILQTPDTSAYTNRISICSPHWTAYYWIRLHIYSNNIDYIISIDPQTNNHRNMNQKLAPHQMKPNYSNANHARVHCTSLTRTSATFCCC